jgi:hypothetical protein
MKQLREEIRKEIENSLHALGDKEGAPVRAHLYVALAMLEIADQLDRTRRGEVL